MADINVSPDMRMGAFVNETDHLMNIVEQAKPERLKLKSDIDILSTCIIDQDPARFDRPAPLVRGRDDFALL